MKIQSITLPLLGVALSVFLASTPSAFAQEAENLIKNPSFEEKGAEGQSVIARWGFRIRGDVPELKPSFTQAQNGQDGKKAAARFDVPRFESPSKKRGMLEWFQSVRVHPGTRYYFSVYQRVGDLASCWVHADIEQLSTSNPEVFAENTKAVSTVESDETKGQANEWHLQEATIKAGQETNYLRVSLRMQDIGATGVGGGWVEFSNAKLIELPPE